MSKDYVNTYSYFDNKGRRLAVFCRYIDHSTAEILTIACSDKDQFRKKYAIQQYEKYLSYKNTDTLPELDCHPKIEQVTIVPEERELKTLIRYCQANYFVLIELPYEILRPLLLTAEEYLDLINSVNN